MRRLFLTALTALCSVAANAQSGAAAIESFFQQNGPTAEDGAITVAGPIITTYTGADASDVMLTLDLEAGVEYMIVAITPSGEGSDPDIYVANGVGDEMASGVETDEGEILFFVPETSATYTIEFVVFGDGDA
ncbi:hypothetical protein, partial [Rubrivirga sp.]|uniref:hypothetical protein n=1 Tax=Rubrivirga sp. TaxID=1885344 RepID=UPI003C7808C7